MRRPEPSILNLEDAEKIRTKLENGWKKKANQVDLASLSFDPSKRDAELGQLEELLQQNRDLLTKKHKSKYFYVLSTIKSYL